MALAISGGAGISYVCDFLLDSICIVWENCYILRWKILLHCPREVADSTELLKKLIRLTDKT